MPVNYFRVLRPESDMIHVSLSTLFSSPAFQREGTINNLRDHFPTREFLIFPQRLQKAFFLSKLKWTYGSQFNLEYDF